jgi:DNA polymerase (family 10)
MAEKERINEKIARIFYEIADIFEIKNVKWKPQAYRVAAQTLESSKDIQDIYLEQGKPGLIKLSGIGESLAEKIIQYLETEKIDEYEKLKKSIPQGLYQMMNIPGIGAKKASLFYNKLGIKNIKQLEESAKKHKLLGLPGFKEKSEKNILSGISLLKQEKPRIPLQEAEKIANPIVNQLKKLKQVEKIIVAGSIRRKKPTIGDIDIVIETRNPGIVADKFIKMPFVKKILGKGKEKATIITKSGMQVDIRLFNENEFGAGLLYFTGDKGHNIWLRKIAIKKGYKLNEYGLFSGNKRVAGRTEQEIYKKLGVKYLEPEKRIGEISQESN